MFALTQIGKSMTFLRLVPGFIARGRVPDVKPGLPRPETFLHLGAAA